MRKVTQRCGASHEAADDNGKSARDDLNAKSHLLSMENYFTF